MAPSVSTPSHLQRIRAQDAVSLALSLLSLLFPQAPTRSSLILSASQGEKRVKTSSYQFQSRGHCVPRPSRAPGSEEYGDEKGFGEFKVFHQGSHVAWCHGRRPG